MSYTSGQNVRNQLFFSYIQCFKDTSLFQIDFPHRYGHQQGQNNIILTLMPNHSGDALYKPTTVLVPFIMATSK